MSDSKSELDVTPRPTPHLEAAFPLVDHHMNEPAAAPFVKWAGGKRSVISQLEPYFPDRISRYWEPSLGGGAAFFAFHDRMDRAVLSDANEELVITFHVVKTNVDALILRLRIHAEQHHETGYYVEVRKEKPRKDLDIAARFIYLNKTCYNGLYRVNKQGQFNVPKGNYRNPNNCDEPRLRAASKALQIAQIKIGDFERVVSPSPHDFIYCDPPYDGCFANYQSGGFGDEDQKRLKKAADRWATSDSQILISNSETKMIRKLYRDSGYRTNTINGQRHISADASTRGSIQEVVISNHVKRQ